MTWIALFGKVATSWLAQKAEASVAYMPLGSLCFKFSFLYGEIFTFDHLATIVDLA